MKTKNLLFALVAILVISFASCNTSVKTTKIETEADSVSYSLGNSIGTNLKTQFADVNPDIVAEAFVAAFEGEENKLFATPQEADMAIRAYMKRASEKAALDNLAKGEAFLAENAAKDGITVTESGLQYQVVVEGSGVKPTEESTVSVTYHGTTIDGTVFDSSIERGDTVSFPLNGVIKGWTEGLQLMPVGSKYKFFIPADLAYGQRGAGGEIGPNSALIFEVELIDIINE